MIFNKIRPWQYTAFCCGLILAACFYFAFLHKEVESTLLSVQGQVVEELPPEFQPELLSWELVTAEAEWQPRDSAASFIFQDKMWVIGGLNGNREVDTSHFVEYWEAPHFNDIWTSSDGVNWEKASTSAPWPVRRSMSVVEFKDSLWMFGGWSPIAGYTSDIWKSENGIDWQKVVSNAPWSSREGHNVEVFQDKLWMIGGVNYDNREVMNEVWVSENGIDWQRVTETIPWSGRWDLGTAVFDNKLFVAGGMNLSDEEFNDVWVSSDGVRWELLEGNPPWQARQGHLLLVFKDRLWLVGRLNDKESGGVNDVWFSKDGVLWEKTLTDPLWAGREDHGALVFNGRMYVFGGMDKDWVWRNDVWVSSN